MADQKKVLLVERNLFIGGILGEKIKAGGIELQTVADGKEGLHRMRVWKPDLTLVDLEMPQLLTFDSVYKKLKEEQRMPQSKLLLLGSSTAQKDIDTIAGLGADAYLFKAYTDIDEISNKILEMVSGTGISPTTVATNGPMASIGGKTPHDKELVPLVSAQKKLRAEIERLIVLPDEELAIVGLVDNLIEFSYWARASDIHIKPEEDRVLVRLRIDGSLHDSFVFPKSIHSEVITRIKVLAGMRTDEHQAAQDGRFKTDLKTVHQKFDVRVSVVPTYYGEDAVMRLLVEQVEIRGIDDMPMSQADLKRLHHAIEKPYGMILATGPTGSGKTTTLYTILRNLSQPDVSIITIEDPVEYSLSGINQIQVNARTGLTFADGLRSILRQDPDIIMVGEIRDKETAGIAVNAALTGHLLLTTIHTNDAATTLPRLLDMGIEPFLIASTVNIAIGQRLIRTICQKCKAKRKVSEVEFKSLVEFIPKAVLGTSREFFQGTGCDKCGNSGYSGRTGIYEILEVEDEIREAIMKRVNATEIKKIAQRKGMTTMIEDGFRKAKEGITTIEEILRVVRE